MQRKNENKVIRSNLHQKLPEAVQEIVNGLLDTEIDLANSCEKCGSKFIFPGFCVDCSYRLSHEERIRSVAKAANFLVDTLSEPGKESKNYLDYLAKIEKNYLEKLNTTFNDNLSAQQKIFQDYLHHLNFSLRKKFSWSQSVAQKILEQAENCLLTEESNPSLQTLTSNRYVLNGVEYHEYILQVDWILPPLTEELVRDFLNILNDDKAEWPSWATEILTENEIKLLKAKIQGKKPKDFFNKDTIQEVLNFISAKYRSIPGMANYRCHRLFLVKGKREKNGQFRYESRSLRSIMRSSIISSRDIPENLEELRHQYTQHGLNKVIRDHQARYEELAQFYFQNKDSFPNKIKRYGNSEKYIIHLPPALLQTLITPIPGRKPDNGLLKDKNTVIANNQGVFKINKKVKFNGKDILVEFHIPIINTNHPLNYGRIFLPIITRGPIKIFGYNLYKGSASSQEIKKLLSLAEEEIANFSQFFEKKDAKSSSDADEDSWRLRLLSNATNDLKVLSEQSSLANLFANNHRELFLASLEQLVVESMNGIPYGSCVSGKDRKSVEIMHTDAMLIYYERYGVLPKFTDAGEKRQNFVNIVADLHLSYHHQSLASMNAPGAFGLKNPAASYPKDIQQAIQKRFDAKLNGQNRSVNLLKNEDRLSNNNDLYKLHKKFKPFTEVSREKIITELDSVLKKDEESNFSDQEEVTGDDSSDGSSESSENEESERELDVYFDSFFEEKLEEDEFSEFIIDNESDKCQKILDEMQENFSRVLTNRPSFLKRFWNLFSKEEKELEKIRHFLIALHRLGKFLEKHPELKENRKLHEIIEKFVLSITDPEFYRLFKIVWKDRGKPIFARTASGDIVKFRVINQNLIATKIIKSNNEEIRLESEERKKFLANQHLTLMIDPLCADVINTDQKKVLFYDESWQPYWDGNYISLDENGLFELKIRSFRSISQNLRPRVVDKISWGLEFFDAIFKVKSTDTDLSLEENENRHEKFKKAIRLQRQMAQKIFNFNNTYQRRVKIYAEIISYGYALISGLNAALISYYAITGVDVSRIILSYFSPATVATLGTKSAVGIGASAFTIFLASPIGFAVLVGIASIFFIVAIYYFYQAKFETPTNSGKKWVAPLIIGLLILLVPCLAMLSVTYAPALVGFYLMGLIFLSTMYTNRRLTKQTSRDALINLVGQRMNEFGKGLFIHIDESGIAHHLHGGYKLFFIVGIIAVVCIAFLVALLAIEPFVAILFPMATLTLSIPVLIFVIVAAIFVFKATFVMTIGHFRHIVFEMQEKGMWRTLKGQFIPEYTESMSEVQAALIVILSTSLFILIFPLAMLGAIAMFSVGGHILAHNILGGWLHLSHTVSGAIATSILSIATLGGQIFFNSAIVRDCVQEYFLPLIVNLFTSIREFFFSKPEKSGYFVMNHERDPMPALPPYERDTNAFVETASMVITTIATGVEGAGNPHHPTPLEVNLFGMVDVSIQNQPNQFGVLTISVGTDYGTGGPLARVTHPADNANEKNRALKAWQLPSDKSERNNRRYQGFFLQDKQGVVNDKNNGLNEAPVFNEDDSEYEV